MMKKSEIQENSIVKFDGRFYRVADRFEDSVNLIGMFSTKTLHIGVSVELMSRAETEWYEIHPKIDSILRITKSID